MAENAETTGASTVGGRLLRWLPGLQVLRSYQKGDLGPDMLAGLVICLVLIPSVLAHSQLARVGPVAGFYAAFAATLAYFVFASSRHMNVGPDGAVALLAGTVILPLTAGDPAKGLVVSAWLAVFTGAILVTAATLRLGVVASFLSTPVLLGYLNGAALVIIVSQWDKLFGISLEEDDLVLRFVEWIGKVPDTHLATFAVGMVVIVLLFIFKRLIPRLPPLVPVFFIALVAGLLVDFEAMGIAVLGPLSDRAPNAIDLSLDLHDIARLAMGALGLSMLIFPEGVLLSRAMAEKHDYRTDPDRELVALGAANLASGAFQGFAVGGSQTRTLVNSASGGRTQVANLASAGFLVLFLAFASEWLVSLPMVAIGAILIYTGFGLVDVAGVRRIWGRHRQTAWIALATTAAVVFIGVLPGILLGTALSIAILLAEIARPQDALLGRRPGSEDLHDVGDDDKAVGIPGLVAYRFYGPLIFANVGYFIDRLQHFIDRQEHPVRQVVIDASAMPSIDFTAAEKLEPYLEKLTGQGITVAIARAHLPLRESKLVEDMAAERPEVQVFSRVPDAIADFEARSRAEADSE